MRLYLIIVIIFFGGRLYAQTVNTDTLKSVWLEPLQGSRLDSIGRRLGMGDKNALFQIAPYLDSNRLMLTRLGYHRIDRTQNDIVHEFLEENCSFFSTATQFEELKASDFLAFLNNNNGRIFYDTDAGMFLITPLKDREVKFAIYELSPQKKSELKTGAGKLLTKDGIGEDGIDILIKEKNPLALFKIAAILYRVRNGYSERPQLGEDECMALLELLTGVDVAVENDQHKITTQFINIYGPTSRFNLLIYFAKYYNNYTWNDKTSRFENKLVKVKSLDKEAIYFELLSSKDDAVALNAFIKLTTCNPIRIKQLAEEYENNNTSTNSSITHFPFDFLKRIAVLTAYCQMNNINFKGSKSLIENINQLKRRDLTFGTRRKLEDKLVQTTTLNDVTALEYWRVIYAQEPRLNYSIARILDIFYTRHWNNVVRNKKQLDLYLKKSLLLDSLGGIVYTKYLTKFVGSDNETIDILRQNRSSDSIISKQNSRALEMALKKFSYSKFANKPEWDGNFNAEVKDLEKEFTAIIQTEPDLEKRERPIVNLYSKINYNQIELALKLIDTVQFRYNKSYKYSFVERDFGFFGRDFDDNKTRNEFLAYYSTHTEWEVYEHYLHLAETDYQNKDGSLNFDKIYELLKYDVVGGYDQEVYLVIKLLELTFKTTLGFPVKLCNSNGSYHCNSTDRTKVWMAYLSDKNLLKQKHEKAVSFGY